MTNQTGVDWPTCSEDGCIGVQLARSGQCLAHATTRRRNAALKRFAETGGIDARGVPEPPTTTPQVLKVDDFATRKGQVYASILLDMATHRPIDVLPDRTADTLAGWLKAHPGVEIVCRDRASAYADGTQAGARQAQQVADRWHLWRSLGEALDKALFPALAYFLGWVDQAWSVTAGLDRGSGGGWSWPCWSPC